MGWEVAKASEKESRVAPQRRQGHQSSPCTVSHEAQWTPPCSRVQYQVDVIHLVCSKGTIMSSPHLHSVKSCPEKSRPIKYGDQMHGVMITIEYSYELGRKKYFNLWCELGRLLLRQSHILLAS